MLNCDDIRDLGAAYPDGGLRPTTRVAVFLHLLLCGACRGYVRGIRRLRGLLAGLPPLSPPASARSRTLHRFRDPLS